jgi:hypothetical protein
VTSASNNHPDLIFIQFFKYRLDINHIHNIEVQWFFT